MDEIELEDAIDAVIRKSGLSADVVASVLDVMKHRYEEDASSANADE